MHRGAKAGSSQAASLAAWAVESTTLRAWRRLHIDWPVRVGPVQHDCSLKLCGSWAYSEHAVQASSLLSASWGLGSLHY